MKASHYIARKLLSGIPLLLGVTFISFLLMVYFGPDKTFELLGKNPTIEQISEVREQLGYDRPFLSRYAQYIRELVTLDLGRLTGESEATIGSEGFDTAAGVNAILGVAAANDFALRRLRRRPVSLADEFYSMVEA